MVQRLTGSLLLIRLEFLLLDFTLLPFAALLSGTTNIVSFFLLLLAIISINGGTHTLNEFYDSGPDSITRKKSPIARGLITNNWAFAQAITMKLFGLSLLYIFFGSVYLLLGMVCVFLSILYSAPRFRIKSIAFVGTLLLTLFYMTEFFLAYRALGGLFNTTFYAWVGIIFTNYFFTIGLGKDYKDYEADKAYGINNPIVKLGSKSLSRILSVVTFIPMVLLSFFILTNSIGLISSIIYIVLLLKIYEVILLRKEYPDGLRIHNIFLTDSLLLVVIAIFVVAI